MVESFNFNGGAREPQDNIPMSSLKLGTSNYVIESLVRELETTKVKLR